MWNLIVVESVRSTGKRFFEVNLRLIHPEIFLKEFHLTTCKETEKQSLKSEGRRLFTQVKTHKIKAQFQC